MHTVTFLHGFVLFHSPKGIPIYFQTIENDAKTLPCAHSHNLNITKGPEGIRKLYDVLERYNTDKTGAQYLFDQKTLSEN